MIGRHIKRDFMKRLGYRKMESPHKTLDPFSTQRQLLGPNPPSCIFDVGANFGQSVKAYRRAFPDTKIYSFEPIPELFQTLKKATEQDPNAFPFQLALSNQTGIQTFYTNDGDSNHSLLGEHQEGKQWASIQHTGTIQVNAQTIDDFCKEQGIEEISVLKIDAEGGDLCVIQGAERMLEEKRVHLLYCECLFVPIFSGQPYFYDIYAHMAQKGYFLFDLYEHRYSKEGRIKLANALFVRP